MAMACYWLVHGQDIYDTIDGIDILNWDEQPSLCSNKYICMFHACQLIPWYADLAMSVMTDQAPVPADAQMHLCTPDKWDYCSKPDAFCSFWCTGRPAWAMLEPELMQCIGRCIEQAAAITCKPSGETVAKLS